MLYSRSQRLRYAAGGLISNQRRCTSEPSNTFGRTRLLKNRQNGLIERAMNIRILGGPALEGQAGSKRT